MQKRLRSPVSDDDFEDDDGAHYHKLLHRVDANNGDESSNWYTYGFGEFGEYMFRPGERVEDTSLQKLRIAGSSCEHEQSSPR